MTKQFFAQIELNDNTSKGGYGIGLQIGQQLLESGMAVKAEAVAKGIYDALNHHQPALELSELSQALNQLSLEAEQAQQAKAQQAAAEGEEFLAENGKKEGVTVTDSGLQYEIIKQGNGEIPTRQDKVRVHYTGKLIDGTVFDSSESRGVPAEFPVSGVIAGWVEALQLMPVGSKWRLTIPQNLAYGERGAGASIPPFATLVFDVELLAIL